MVKLISVSKDSIQDRKTQISLVLGYRRENIYFLYASNELSKPYGLNFQHFLRHITMVAV